MDRPNGGGPPDALGAAGHGAGINRSDSESLHFSLKGMLARWLAKLIDRLTSKALR